MKKQYINPTMEVVKLHAQELLAGSVIGKGTGTKNPGAADSREFDPFWDDEEW